MLWLWCGLGIGLVLFALVAAGLALHVYVVRYYLEVVSRIFQEKPLFVVPRGQPAADAEEVAVPKIGRAHV